MFPDIPVCIKVRARSVPVWNQGSCVLRPSSSQGNETRMGKGKGTFEFWSCRYVVLLLESSWFELTLSPQQSQDGSRHFRNRRSQPATRNGTRGCVLLSCQTFGKHLERVLTPTSVPLGLCSLPRPRSDAPRGGQTPLHDRSD